MIKLNNLRVCARKRSNISLKYINLNALKEKTCNYAKIKTF